MIKKKIHSRNKLKSIRKKNKTIRRNDLINSLLETDNSIPEDIDNKINTELTISEKKRTKLTHKNTIFLTKRKWEVNFNFFWWCS